MSDHSTPLSYRDIKRICLDRIQQRIWQPDSLLPNENELATEFSSTRTTVNRALRELAAEGYLERKRKSGTRVLQAPIRRAQFAVSLVRDEISARGATYRYALVDQDLSQPPEWLAPRLDLRKDSEMVHLRCLHFADETPFQFEERWISVDTIPAAKTADFSLIGPNEWLVRNVPFTDLSVAFSAAQANKSVADFLGCTPGSAIFVTERSTWLRGQPVTFAKLHFAPGYRVTAHA